MIEKQYIYKTCNTIKEILSYNKPIVWSWGVEGFRYTEFQNMPALRFRVNGFLHKGDVVVAYNGGADTFEVYCLNRSNKISNSHDDVYFDVLVDVIDRMVEKDCSQENYSEQVSNWCKEL
ncbi:MAG: hypothetical protein SNJ29_15130 [Rikenellaceae bacterium]